MTPPARTQAAIDILDLVVAAARHEGAAADTIFQRYFATRRYAGSGDRRAVRDLVFDVVRAIGAPPASGRAAMIGHARAIAPQLLDHFGAPGHAPPAIGPAEAGAPLAAAPAWLAPRLAAAFGDDATAETAALLERAPLDLRVNLLKATRDEVAALFPALEPTPHSPWGLRSPPFAIERETAFTDGLVAIQDEGSQLVALACAARPDEIVVDLCAGAGGKTLALAAMMRDRGRIVAADIDRARLRELGLRAHVAGVTIAEPRLLDQPAEAAGLADLAGRADLVLVDAPCSGSGTWRRNPEARWRLTPAWLTRLAATQDRLLGIAAALVRPGGRLIYAVCSILPDEGRDRAAAFVATHPDFAAAPLAPPVPGAPDAATLLSPHRTHTDGFFIAGFARIC